ncbi:PaaI family thioesterase [Paenibacillus caseinilyticus]|uniref:Thioesterase n=1 Tax=Paenibacillus mucilaginosus K02 TaxID=997761 RepID=I0BQN4_9BACL|nr:PaaI family thioesterase [Paenibacillus mucilaginosus]AFH64681.1 thioesterase [Paenibacillus mucilaginosus K02]
MENIEGGSEAHLELLKASSPQGTFWDHVGGEVTEFGADRVAAALKIEAHHLNMLGILHGGVHAALLDSIMGLMAMAVRPLEAVVTTNLNLHYLSSVRKGTVTVSAEVIHQSRRMVTTQGYVHAEDGTLCAYGTGTFRVLESSAGGGKPGTKAAEDSGGPDASRP